MKFELTPEEIGKVYAWKAELELLRGSKYYGAIGGELTYCFTPTSLGVIVVVKFGEHELDLTDYNW